MQATPRRLPLSLAPILPARLRKWTEPIEPALHRILIPHPVLHAFEAVRESGGSAEFARGLLDSLNIRFSVEPRDLGRVPAEGAVVAVANHPFGFVEGLALIALLERIRPDARILANSLLGGIAAIRRSLILVNPFESADAARQNYAALREARGWLSGGGLLAIFPGGEVASMNWKEHTVTDPTWKTTAARLATKSNCPVLPMFFTGANSVSFQLAGTILPVLRTLSLAREFYKLSGTTVHLRIGNPIPANVLAGHRDAGDATDYIRSKTFFLANRSPNAPAPAGPQGPTSPGVFSARGDRLLSEEVAGLPADCRLCATGEFSAYLAPAATIPRMLQEIGRCRELAFRQTGEGTGNERDLDRFDLRYQHLFLWNHQDSRLAGAYRLAVTTDLLAQYGVAGLYSSTLFRFHPRFFDALGPAVELGRSFIIPEYQKSYAPLLLLWKGITRAVQRRPEAPILFGAVSISNRYLAASRGLLVNYLSARASHDLSPLVEPRQPFRHAALHEGHISRLASLATDLEDVSLSIADIEQDSKGVPVLLRQYLKAGGRVLGFNLDPKFSDVLDALLVADLRTAPAALLDRCMGRAEAKAFLERTAERSVTNA